VAGHSTAGPAPSSSVSGSSAGERGAKAASGAGDTGSGDPLQKAPAARGPQTSPRGPDSVANGPRDRIGAPKADAATDDAADDAAAWLAAATAHEQQGRKAFTGKGYQEQHAAVAAAAAARTARAADSRRRGSHTGTAAGEANGLTSLRRVWRRALYGPHADDPAASLG
jgi:hypothetical protein